MFSQVSVHGWGGGEVPLVTGPVQSLIPGPGGGGGGVPVPEQGQDRG